MKKNVQFKRIYIVAIAVLFVFVALSATTYSLFLTSNSVANLTYNTGLLDLELVEDEPISLMNLLPVVDSDGVNLKPYTLKIKNVGTLPYLFDLTMVSTNSKNVIDNRYIKVKVNNALPFSLNDTADKIVTENIIYPNEEKTFKINVWLDIETPNKELGKAFDAKIVVSGSAVYKMLDTSGANQPNMSDDMLPVYYNDSLAKWQIADRNNMLSQYEWYNYDNQKWANAVIVNNSDKKVYDITRNNDLSVSSLKVNNGDVVIDDHYFDIGLKNYEGNKITEILRVKFDDLKNDRVYITTNGSLTYYYDVRSRVFVLKNGNNTVTSKQYDIRQDNWYVIGYSYDGSIVSFYADGNRMSTSEISGAIGSDKSFKFGTDADAENVSKITISDILIYNRILSDNEIGSNYKNSVNPIYDGLVCGYNEFSPMTLSEYYLSKDAGFSVENDDIQRQLVWIPRYKYRVWNVTGENNVTSYDALNTGIEIVFEEDNNSTGTISCSGDTCMTIGLTTDTVTKEDNGKYYTHPAFTDGNKELTGFWVSKYEISTDSAAGSIKSRAGNTVWTNGTLATYHTAISKLNNYQVIRNIDWGAITYLGHSNYGLCINKVCKNVTLNSTYISGKELLDSTTGNIYGVFDMVGGASEYMMNDNTINTYNKGGFLLGDGTKELLSGDKIWYANTYDYHNDKGLIVRGGNKDGDYVGMFSFTSLDDGDDNNLSTRFTVK